MFCDIILGNEVIKISKKITVEVEVVSSGKREVIDMGDFNFIYIPMNQDEVGLFYKENPEYKYMFNLCFRLKINKGNK